MLFRKSEVVKPFVLGTTCDELNVSKNIQNSGMIESKYTPMSIYLYACVLCITLIF